MAHCSVLLLSIDIMSAPQAASSWAGTSILEIARMEQAYSGAGFTIDISTLASAALPQCRRTEQSLRPTLVRYRIIRPRILRGLLN
ncbi:hypothetical protein K438DRAFT_411758 [Mycena galopus ATCC 62051]|nr:hypothetical protein K438DRAFT_411758 [Mycena galopus ATCC 62051]